MLQVKVKWCTALPYTMEKIVLNKLLTRKTINANLAFFIEHLTDDNFHLCRKKHAEVDC